MFIALIPTTLHDLARVRLILFFVRIGKQPHVVVNVKVE
jgi:hypothetical protein